MSTRPRNKDVYQSDDGRVEVAVDSAEPVRVGRDPAAYGFIGQGARKHVSDHGHTVW